jgi:hypothetical protein
MTRWTEDAKQQLKTYLVIEIIELSEGLIKEIK